MVGLVWTSIQIKPTTFEKERGSTDDRKQSISSIRSSCLINAERAVSGDAMSVTPSRIRNGHKVQNILEGPKVANPKYREILEKIRENIQNGHYKPGQRLPSEAELVRRHCASRMTVFRAMRELQALGIIRRRVGSGTFVSEHINSDGHTFGLLIPELGQTEIFEAICKGMMETQQAVGNSLLWGNTNSANNKHEVAQQLCHHFISQHVSGVFFAPVEFAPVRDRVNHQIVAALDRAGIPVVLLDRCIEPYPNRSNYDLVGIDNRRTAYMATEHLIRSGAHRIAFFCRPNSAPTVDARVAGYREALGGVHSQQKEVFVYSGDPSDADIVKGLLKRDRVDAFLCANDNTAGHLMHTLISLNRRIPEDIRIVGIDDVKFARLLPVPLTTLHQPCRDIGRVALSVMLDRLDSRDMPPRDVLLGCNLIVRKSCGSANRPIEHSVNMEHLEARGELTSTIS
jgi:DNA-binding LacI/PurR family transcriptional regulator